MAVAFISGLGVGLGVGLGYGVGLDFSVTNRSSSCSPRNILIPTCISSSCKHFKLVDCQIRHSYNTVLKKLVHCDVLWGCGVFCCGGYNIIFFEGKRVTFCL